MENYGIYIDFHNFYNEAEEIEEVCWGMTKEEAEKTVAEINKISGNKYPYIVLAF